MDEFSDDAMGELGTFAPLDGGWSGETFMAETAGERSVVRLYARPSRRGPAAHEVDAALLGLVRGLVPVPDVLEVRRAQPATGLPALLVTSFLPGTRADLLLLDLAPSARAALGNNLGALLADLGGMPMLSPGQFVDGALRIEGVGDGDGLPWFLEECEPVLAHLEVAEMEGLREVAVEAQALLDTVGRHCLVHGDLNPKNLLVDPVTLRVTGLVDWEFAHAGHPFSDLGNLLRFERDDDLGAAVLETYVARRGGPVGLGTVQLSTGEALALARAADLWALIDLAGRRHANPVAARADRLLRTIARERNPSAALPPGDRTD